MNCRSTGFFATALALQSETGGTVTDTLDRLAEVIRKRVALREHARALASEARTSIAILAAFAVFPGTALALINPGYISIFVYRPQGRGVLIAAISSLSIGVVTMRTSCRGAWHDPANASCSWPSLPVCSSWRASS